MNRADGVPVNAVFGFTNMLAKFLRENIGTHLAVIFDAGKATFRDRIYDQYKAHRPDPPDDLLPQFPLVREATAAFGVPAIELADWEADDLIASYARAAVAAGGRVTIASSDKDLMQLLGPGIDMLDPIRGKPIGPAEVMEKFGVPPEKLIDVQALMGDSIDNVPGVPGIGPKNAAQLIQEYGDLETVLAAAPAMKPSKRRDNLIAHAENARLSRRLVTLREDAPLPVPIGELACCDPDRDALAAFLRRNGFRSVLLRMGLEHDGVPPAPAAQPEPEHRPAPPPAREKIPFGPYVTVTTPAALEQWVAEANASGVVAIGVVADSTEPLRANLLGLALATAPGRAGYVPVLHTVLEPQLSPAQVLGALAPIFADPGVLNVFHDAKFAVLVLARAGAAEIAPVDDTMLISYAQEAGAHGHALDELSPLHLNHQPVAIEQVTGSGRARVTFADAPLERATAHAAEAADITLRLWHTLRSRLREKRSLAHYEQIDRRLLRVLAEMERCGIKVDADDLRRMSADFSARMAIIEQEVFRLAGREFTLGSPKQLGEILFDELKLGGSRRTKTGAHGTNAAILQQLADEGHDLPARVLDWRQLAKLKSTYADALVDEINPETGRVHTSFAMAVASTGRLSSNNPNLQNIPIRTEEGSRIRRAFIAEAGHVLVSADYSQIELRLLAHVAEIPALRESFSRGEDIHARTASEVFGIPMAGMDPLTRRRAKAINFGIIYGISAFGLGRQLGVPPGEAKLYIDAYFARYPGIRDYMERTKEEARIAGYVLTPFGRRCWIPGIAERNPTKRGYAERQAINAPLQGGAADIIKRAMVRLPAALAEAGLRARLLLQVHDELLFEAPDDEAIDTARIAREVMERAARLSVPLVAETGIGRTWAEAH
jgi:DNA polymerase-1